MKVIGGIISEHLSSGGHAGGPFNLSVVWTSDAFTDNFSSRSFQLDFDFSETRSITKVIERARQQIKVEAEALL